jgi:hypothetical protein
MLSIENLNNLLIFKLNENAFFKDLRSLKSIYYNVTITDFVLELVVH